MNLVPSFLKRNKTGGELLKQNPVQPNHAAILRKEAEKTRRLPNGSRVRMYDAAVTNQGNVDFPISITSSNAEILTSISATRARARRLVRDNPYACGIQNVFSNNVAGEDPFRLDANVGKFDDSGKFIEETETNRKLKAWWKEAGKPENCTVMRNMSRMEMYNLAVAAMVRDGGVLFRHRRAYPKNKFGYAIEPIEIDRLDHFYNRPANGTANEIQFSIEMDEWHAPIAYWILTRHPGDVFAYSNQPKYRERVDAKDVVPLFNLKDRAGQYVGMSVFAPVTQRLHRIDQYDVAEMQAAIVGAIKIGFFTKNETSDTYTASETTPEGLKIDNIEQGVNFEELPANYDVKEFNPNHPVEAYAAFTDQNLRSIAVGSKLSHSAVSGNYAGMSFSTGRLEKMPERETFKVYQEHVKANLVIPHFREALKYAMLSGELDIPFSRYEEIADACCFKAKRWEYINPMDDVQSDILRIQHGLDSRSNVIAESSRGGDVESVDSEIASDKAIDEAHKLDFSQAEATKPTAPASDAAQAAKAPSKAGSKKAIT